MKLNIILLISFFAVVLPLWAKTENKQPDTYAYTRGVEAYNEEKYADAMDWFNRELTEHPDNGYAFVYISILRYGNQEYGKALSAIDNALKKLPKKDKEWRSFTFASRAGVYTTMGDTIKALQDLSQAIQINPSNARFYNSRAQLYYEQKNYALADADYQKMINLDQGDVMTRVRDKDNQIGHFTIWHKSSGDPNGSPDFYIVAVYCQRTSCPFDSGTS